MRVKITIAALVIFLSMQLHGAECPPQPPRLPISSQSAFESLPAEIKRTLLLINAQSGPVLNISALAHAIIDLSATGPRMRKMVNNPQNMLALLKSLPTDAAAVSLAYKLKTMSSIQSEEVQNWLKAIKLENGQELFNAVKAEDSENVAKFLKKRNINVNELFDDGLFKGYTALMWAAEEAFPEITLRILAAGADPNIAGPKGRTALNMAVRNHHNVEIIKLLLAAGANPNKANDDGYTALYQSFPMAEFAKDTTIMKLLIAAHADVNTHGYEDVTILMTAVERGNSKIAKLLLASGANPRLKDFSDQTARDKVNKDQRPDLYKLLLDAEAYYPCLLIFQDEGETSDDESDSASESSEEEN